jgi:hypothetical protein
MVSAAWEEAGQLISAIKSHKIFEPVHNISVYVTEVNKASEKGIARY